MSEKFEKDTAIKQALKMLLECPALNQDDLEGYDVEAIDFAHKALNQNKEDEKIPT